MLYQNLLSFWGEDKDGKSPCQWLCLIEHYETIIRANRKLWGELHHREPCHLPGGGDGIRAIGEKHICLFGLCKPDIGATALGGWGACGPPVSLSALLSRMR